LGNSDPAPTIDARTRSRPSSLGSDFPPGTQLGRYLVLGELGKGAMGAVYAAYDSELDRRVALKFLRNRATEADADGWRARFMREAKAMARLSHPNVVTLYDVGLSSAGQVFLAMEVVEGGTLGDWLKAEPRSWREIVSLLCEAGEGLAAAHRAGMIHRDFKLDNVLFGKDGRPRVTDFGLARSADGDAEGPSMDACPIASSPSLEAAVSGTVTLSAALPASPASASSLSTLTLPGAMMGTPGYMAPEQYTNAVEVDARADIFAFCATLYRALYGERAFAGETVEQIAESTLIGGVRAPPKGSDVPAWLHKVILRGLATEREARPASMGDILAALRADPAKRWRRWLIASAVATASCAIALSVHAAGERRVRACHAMADRLGGVWDGPRKEAIRSAFVATGVSYAEGTWARVEQRLDAYATALASSTDAACEATRVRGEQSEAMLDLRTSCLDERLDELRALGDVFARASAKTVGKAVQAASSLRSLEPCSNLDQLSAATRLPSEPTLRGEIRALQAEIAGANERRVTGGNQTESWKHLQEIHERVAKASYGPLVVAWSMAAARCKIDGNLKDTAAEWESAIALAETYHLDRERADSQMRLGRVLNDLGRHEDAHLLLDFAAATLARIGGDPALGLERDVYEGLDYLNEGKYADAARVLEHAISRANAEHVPDPVRVATAQSLLGGALLYDQNRFDEAVTQARAGVALSEEALGQQHPSIGTLMSNLSIVEREVGRLDDALASASRSLAIYQGAMARGEIPARDTGSGEVLLNAGEALVRLGRAGEAIDLIEKARAVDRANDQSEGLLDANVALAKAWRQLGRVEEAARASEEARAIAKEDKETSPISLVELLVVEANLNLDRGKADAALPLAEQAVSLARAGFSYLYDLSSARLVLARALVQKPDAARARIVAEEARSGFMKLDDRRRVEEASVLLAQMR
jgi:serine/threonine protein kinase/tetratricopeptide (TPR) repeat protein